MCSRTGSGLERGDKSAVGDEGCGDADEGEEVRRLRHHLIWLGRLPVVTRIVERLVPDELWELFQRVVPEAPSRPQGGGRRRHGDREVLAAIVFVATSGCTWQQLPTASFGPSGATAHRRFTEWTKARVWAKLHRLVLDERGSRGELDWSRCAIDSVNMRALKRGSRQPRIL
jgi:transposase